MTKTEHLPLLAYWSQHKCGSNRIHQVMGKVCRNDLLVKYGYEEDGKW
ncbi:MAG: hypothetical protein KAT34_09695 [Candidatus Aminicenantes bacterium]|nr:hypothetical protein [Candidatus Aminicenantes bacterium]